MTVSFQLTMPNVGSWNGQWTGQGRPYFVIKSFRTRKAVEAFMGEKQKESWYYRWEDGWGANVEAEIITPQEGRKRQKISKGFAGYEWMIDSIIKRGKILATHEIKELEEANANQQPQ